MIADEDYMIRVAEEPTVLKSGPNESDLRRVCLWMMVVSSVLIGLMLVISHYEQSSPATEGNTSQSIAGWIAVVGAAIVFGSTGVPMKSPALVSLEVDSFIFALYTSVGIFLVSLPLIVYLLVIGRFEFKFWAILGAADIVIIGYLAFMAVKRLGYCRAPAIWAGVGMTCAFLWGALVFKEPIKSIPMAVSAIVLLKLGVYAVSTSQGSTLQENVLKINDTVERNENENGISRSRNDVNNEKIETQIGTQREVEGQVDYSGSKDDVNCGNEESKNGVRPGVIDCENGFTVQNNPMNSMRNSKIVDGSVEEVKEERIFHVQVPVRTTNMSVDLDVRAERSLYSEDDRIKKEINDNSEEHSLKENSFTSSSFAYLLCFAVGLCDGALLVPFKLTTYENNGNNGITEVFQYLASFGISSIIVSPILFLFYIFILNKQTVPQFHFHRAFTPGLTSGVLWASANFLSVHATYYLGIKIGFPLTQTCVLIAALWGIFYFKEIDLRGSGFVCRFSLGIFMILCGAYLLGSSQ